MSVEPEAGDRRALLAERLRRKSEQDSAVPLSYAQRRLWFLDQLQPGSAVYNVPLGYDITGPLRVEALERALTEVVRRQEILRTAFRSTGGTPHQVVLPPEPVTIAVVDLTAPGRSADEVARLADEEAGAPFDLVAGRAIRARLLRVADERHRLLVTVHHLACDAFSVGVLGKELAVQYRAALAGQPGPESDLPMQYADFAEWQDSTLAGPELDRLLAYWTDRLAGMRTRHLPTDHPARRCRATGAPRSRSSCRRTRSSGWRSWPGRKASRCSPSCSPRSRCCSGRTSARTRSWSAPRSPAGNGPNSPD
ncbi:hypothetical protein GCM10029964_028750 [Kibdelosporangium lantanae]